jgi:hypothetical protein
LHFDNGSIPSFLDPNTVEQQLEKHVEDLIRLESFIVSAESSGATLSALMLRLAPQLRRVGRLPYTAFISNPLEIVKALRPQHLEVALIEAFGSSLWLEPIFGASSFPKLRELDICEDEYNSTTRDTLPPLRGLLNKLVASTGSLESLGVAFTNFEDSEGQMTDAVREVVLRNNSTLRTLNFSASDETGRPNRFYVCEELLGTFDSIYDGAIHDSSKWSTLPARIKSTFGIDIPVLRIVGASVWQRIMMFKFMNHGTPPPLEHAQALYRAVYPSETTTPQSRIKAFEIFLENASYSAVKSYGTVARDTIVAYRSWVFSEISANLACLDLPSVLPQTILLGLLGLFGLSKAIKHTGDDLHPIFMSIGKVFDAGCATTPWLQALGHSFGFDGQLMVPKVAKLILRHHEKQPLPLLTPVGQREEPLIIFLRNNATETFQNIVDNPKLFDPMEVHPITGMPMILFVLFHRQGEAEREPTSVVKDCFEHLTPIVVRLEDKLEGIRYSSPADMVRFFTHLKRHREGAAAIKLLAQMFLRLEDMCSVGDMPTWELLPLQQQDWLDIFDRQRRHPSHGEWQEIFTAKLHEWMMSKTPKAMEMTNASNFVQAARRVFSIPSVESLIAMKEQAQKFRVQEMAKQEMARLMQALHK